MSTEAEAKKLKEENERLRAELEAARAPTLAVHKKPNTAAVVVEDIVDSKVRALHSKAKSHAEKYSDSPDARKAPAAAAQDHLIALRDLDVPFSGHGVALYAGGDLYIGTKGVHPRNVATELAAVLDVGHLTELVDELRAKLEYEAS